MLSSDRLGVLLVVDSQFRVTFYTSGYVSIVLLGQSASLNSAGVGKLYLPPGELCFGCRHCYDLTYESCRESHRLRGLFRRLGLA